MIDGAMTNETPDDSTVPSCISLRRAAVADADVLADMHARSRASAYRGMLPAEYLDHHVHAEAQAHWPEKMQAIAAGAGDVLIAEREGVPIAFVCMLAPDAQGSVYIDNLHALPHHKGSGAGTAMLDAARHWAEARGAKSMHLLVLEANTAAVGFYQARGWQLAGREDDTMAGVDVVVLRFVFELGST